MLKTAENHNTSPTSFPTTALTPEQYLIIHLIKDAVHDVKKGHEDQARAAERFLFHGSAEDWLDLAGFESDVVLNGIRQSLSKRGV